MIELSDVTYKYPRTEAEVIGGFSARFKRGEITAVTGKNGCGKTTLTKLIVGILHPDGGQITIDGNNAATMDLFDIGRRVGYVFQNPAIQLFCATVYDEIAYGLKNMGLTKSEVEEKARFYLDFFRLDALRDSLPDSLSLGEKQRTALAAVLAMGTDYLILDEPTTGLDIRSREELGALLVKIKQSAGTGVVFISHEADFVSRFADREVVMDG